MSERFNRQSSFEEEHRVKTNSETDSEENFIIESQGVADPFWELEVDFDQKKSEIFWHIIDEF